jgi:hypothetical protein
MICTLNRRRFDGKWSFYLMYICADDFLSLIVVRIPGKLNDKNRMRNGDDKKG